MRPRAPRRVPAVAVLLLCLGAGAARAQDLKDRFNIRLALTGLYLAEQQGDPNRVTTESSSLNLGYLDLRAVIDARRLPGQFELHVDGRARVTGDFDHDAAQVQAGQTFSRGYYGGREYELREAWFRRRGQKVDFALGRMFVAEADSLKIDGVRLWWKFHKKWDLSLFAGGYPNPFSRSLTTDYQGANGYNGVAIAGGADIQYLYDKLWGSLAVVGSYLGGNDDGGPLSITGGVATPANFQTENTRTYISWTGFERFVHWLDLYHSLVLDVAGAAGVQLTRLDAFATVRAHKYFSIRAGYGHLSPLAIEMYLASLLTDRNLFIANTINNNLVVARTARDQARLQLDVHFGKVNVFGEGRLRFRSLQNTVDEPQFANPAGMAPVGQQLAPGFAYDATLGVRDRGSLKGVRLGLWFTYLGDFRSRSYILGFELGRSFFDERLTFDLNFLYANTSDAGAGGTCVASGTLASLVTPGCYGTRDGNSYETGVTFTGNPWKHWFALLDYRLVINDSSVGMGVGRPLILTHVLLLRIEARY